MQGRKLFKMTLIELLCYVSMVVMLAAAVIIPCCAAPL